VLTLVSSSSSSGEGRQAGRQVSRTVRVACRRKALNSSSSKTIMPSMLVRVYSKKRFPDVWSVDNITIPVDKKKSRACSIMQETV
jgi:hypothetical protein